eukprot:13587994-Ditylum_brightwellii.AAC.1
MPDDTIRRIHQLACRNPLGIVIKDCIGTENMHDPPLEQMENDDDDSTYVPNEEGSEKDDDNIPSIDSLMEMPIHHNPDDFELHSVPTDTTTTTTIVDDDNNNIASDDILPEDDIDENTSITGVSLQEEDENDDSSFTTGVTVQADEETSPSSSEEVNKKEPAELAG